MMLIGPYRDQADGNPPSAAQLSPTIETCGFASSPRDEFAFSWRLHYTYQPRSCSRPYPGPLITLNGL